MDADDELCLCFHVSWRKVLNYIRVHRIRTPSQLHECGGAGTGCGWCRKQLERLTALCAENPPSPDAIDGWLRLQTPNKKKYSEGREVYRAKKESDVSRKVESVEEKSEIGLGIPIDSTNESSEHPFDSIQNGGL
ncbi:MAG: (2Fe-2S)-binding protein [Planctomycetes bacterium]|nr:(2Fe-2S)-binding protein [Planctomycetota bacterium]